LISGLQRSEELKGESHHLLLLPPLEQNKTFDSYSIFTMVSTKIKNKKKCVKELYGNEHKIILSNPRMKS